MNYLVADARADIFEPSFAPSTLHTGRELFHLRPLWAGLSGDVHTVHRPRSSLNQSESTLKTQAAVGTSDKRDSVREGELLAEQRGSRGCPYETV